jgi:hypothetical protein
VPQTEPIDRAVEDARRWVARLGPSWVATFDQMHCDVRQWAKEVGVDPRSYEFRASWCVATTFLHRMATVLQGDEPDDAAEMAHVANILATVGLWGTVAAT